jgi:lycopene cyclase domain-containing protein
MTYWALNAIFLGVVALIVVVGFIARRTPNWRAVGLTMVIVLVMTAVFDNIMISVGLVAYSPERISGVFIGVAPLEDFAYAVAAVIGLPALWALLTPRASTRPEGASDA